MMAYPKSDTKAESGGETPQLSPDLAPDCKGPPATEEEVTGAVLEVKRENLVKGRGGIQNKCRIVKTRGFVYPIQYIDLYLSSDKY